MEALLDTVIIAPSADNTECILAVLNSTAVEYAPPRNKLSIHDRKLPGHLP